MYVACLRLKNSFLFYPIEAPTFQKPLTAVSVVEGFPAKLEAKLGGSPPPEISWYFNFFLLLCEITITLTIWILNL